MYNELYPYKVFKILISIISILLVANIAGLVSKFYFGHGRLHGLIPLFDFNRESNIPTMYSSIALIIAGVLLMVIAMAHRKKNDAHIHWAVLSLIFFFLSVDEFASIHEMLIDPVRGALGTSGVLYFSWVVPYAIILLLLAGSYINFLIRLPRKIMYLFLVSGTLYVGGAMGVELFEGAYAELHGFETLTFALFYTVEELLEMVGIAVFIYSLLLYITSQFQFLTISIVAKKG